MFVQSLTKFTSSVSHSSRSQRATSATPPADTLSRSDWRRIVAEMLD
jgi:hypothetical protein